MGIVIGKFGRKKKSTFEVLEKLDNEIESIEKHGRSTEQTRKKIVGRFIVLAILIYLALAVGLYMYYNRISDKGKLIYTIPLIAFPFVIIVIKKILTWYYTWKLRKNEKKLIKLKEEKKKILDNVMENETYKVAKKILDKFGNEKPSQITAVMATTLKAAGPSPSVAVATPQNTPMPGLRQRTIQSEAVKTRLFPRPMLPRERSFLDKMIDYLVEDGPSNRFALICRKCNGHNGMALKNEFEYLSFNCCYCFHHNPAIKKRPEGPKLPSDSPPKVLITELSSESSSESEKEDNTTNSSSVNDNNTEVAESSVRSDAEKSPLAAPIGDESNQSSEAMDLDVETETSERNDN